MLMGSRSGSLLMHGSIAMGSTISDASELSVGVLHSDESMVKVGVAHSARKESRGGESHSDTKLFSPKLMHSVSNSAILVEASPPPDRSFRYE